MRLATLAVITLSTLGAGRIDPAAAQQVGTVWRAATEYPANTVPGQALTAFANLVAQRTAGRVEVVARFDAPDGLRSATIPAAVQDGRLAVGDAFAGALAPIDPLFQLSSLPFLATDVAQAHHLYRLAASAYASRFARLGQRVLYVTPWPASGLWSRMPIAAPGDLKELTMRTYDALGTEVFGRAGADARTLSFADALPEVAVGRLAAVLSSGDGAAGQRMWHTLPNFTAIGYAMPLSFATVSETVLAALDPAVRTQVLATGHDVEAQQWASVVDRMAANETAMRLNGVHIAAATPALAAILAQSAHQAIATWVRTTGKEAADILAEYEKQ